jgi:hypothetical protein
MDGSVFDQICVSRNVRATAVPANARVRPQRASIKIGSREVAMELNVNTSFGGTDAVAVSVYW